MPRSWDSARCGDGGEVGTWMRLGSPLMAQRARELPEQVIIETLIWG